MNNSFESFESTDVIYISLLKKIDSHQILRKRQFHNKIFFWFSWMSWFHLIFHYFRRLTSHQIFLKLNLQNKTVFESPQFTCFLYFIVSGDWIAIKIFPKWNFLNQIFIELLESADFLYFSLLQKIEWLSSFRNSISYFNNSVQSPDFLIFHGFERLICHQILLKCNIHYKTSIWIAWICWSLLNFNDS
jgi:hypothetical protein